MAIATIGASALASAIPWLLNKLFPGKKGEYKALPTMTPEQQGLYGKLFSGLGDPLQQGLGNLSDILSGSSEAFKAFEAPAMRQFNEQIIPGLAERFSGAGAGAQSSSAFQQALGQAGAGLSENLAAMKGTMQQNALGQLAQLLGMAGTPQFQWQGMPGQQGMGTAMAPGIGYGIGSKIGGLSSEDFTKSWDWLKGLLGGSK